MTDFLPGDLLYTRSEGLVGSLIRFGERVRFHGWPTALGRLAGSVGRTITRKPLLEAPDDPSWGNHIAVCMGDGTVIEALAHGLTVTPVDHYQARQYRLLPLAQVCPGVTDLDRAALVAFARFEQARHDSYGWGGIASIVVQLLTPLRLSVSWSDSMICSAFGARCWEHAGVIIPTQSVYTTMPGDLAYMARVLPLTAHMEDHL